jgi:hypothetical protein
MMGVKVPAKAPAAVPSRVPDAPEPRPATRPSRWWGRTGGVALLCWLLHGSVAEAQLQAGSWTSTWSDGRPQSGLLPSLWVDRRGIGASLGANFSLDLDGDQGVALSDRFIIELAGRGTGTRLAGSRRGAGALSARLHWVRPSGGVWFATSGFQVDNTRGMLPLLGAGAWHERGRFTFATQLVQLLSPLRTTHPAAESPVDTSSVRAEAPQSPASEDLRLMTGAETSVTWQLERLALQSRTGFAVSMHHQPAYWGELGAVYRVRPQVGFFGRVRSVTRVPAPLEVTTETNAAVGVQLALGQTQVTEIALRPAKPDFRLLPLGDSRYRLTLRVAGNSVEVASDATEWAPVAATRVADDRWEVELMLSPGVHRIAIRVDGSPWRAPPGLPTALDEFGGEVGLLVVE